MNSKDQRDQRPLGASHVLGGWIKLLFHLVSRWPSPQDGQDCSGSTACQPSPLRSDPYGASGLTCFIHHHVCLNRLDPATTNALGVVRGLIFGSLSIVRRCKQVDAGKIEQHNFPGEIRMATVFKDSIAEDFINEKLEDSFDEVRHRLERTFQKGSAWKNVAEDLDELSKLIEAFQAEKNSCRALERRTSDFLKKLIEFRQKYRRFFQPEQNRQLEDLIQNFRGWVKDLKTLNRMPKVFTPESSEKSFQCSALGLEVFARYIDEEETDLTPESCDAIKNLAIFQRKGAGETKLQNQKKEKYRQRIRYTAAFIIQKVEEYKARTSRELIIGEEPFDQLLKKSQERMHALGWPDTEEDAEKLIAEEEEMERKNHATLDYLNRMLNDE